MDKILITITTCNRLIEVKKYIWDYITFCNKYECFDFLLSLDGNNQEYIDFCEEYCIPLLYSDEREGVGLSKNRVLKKFPDYDYYFFIEDDIELVNSKIFVLLINISGKKKYPHLCNNHPNHIIERELLDDIEITHSKTGGAQIALYSNEGLKKVGGWNTCFAKYKRFGHTEHSYRFYHAGLQPSPFIFCTEAFSMFINHNPPRVTKIKLKTNENELIDEEQKMINDKTSFSSLETISNFYFNNKSFEYNKIVNAFLKQNRKKYPLTKGKDRRTVFSEYCFFKFRTTLGFKSFLWFILTNLYYPLHPNVKHYLKLKLKNVK